MRYTLTENAISSLSIAIEKFKIFYYHSDKCRQSQIDESAKICIVFLENAIELMIKSILASNDPLSIYEQPESKKIKQAYLQTDASHKLGDILISQGNFKTIKYNDTIEKYNNKYHQSEKVYNILKTLGETRNMITHFGIDNTDNWNEFVITILNTFDVIYNYLYPQLIELDEIGDYFTTDNIIVDTIHGKKLLFDRDYIYNNIIDFLDELMETSKEYICNLRASNPKSRICEFLIFIEELFSDHKFKQMLSKNNIELKFKTCDFKNNNFYFTLIKNSEVLDEIFSCYSPYFNVTAFCGECGNIYFLIVHDKHELYIYNQYVNWPQPDEPESDNQWINDCKNNFCSKYNLSKRNLQLAFNNIISED